MYHNKVMDVCGWMRHEEQGQWWMGARRYLNDISITPSNSAILDLSSTLRRHNNWYKMTSQAEARGFQRESSLGSVSLGSSLGPGFSLDRDQQQEQQQHWWNRKSLHHALPIIWAIVLTALMLALCLPEDYGPPVSTYISKCVDLMGYVADDHHLSWYREVLYWSY